MNNKRMRRTMTWRRFITMRSRVANRGTFSDGTPFEILAWYDCKPPIK